MKSFRSRVWGLAALVALVTWASLQASAVREIHLPLRSGRVVLQAKQPTNGPPPEAYTACQGHVAGDTVQYTTPQGTVTAVCKDSPKGLVARPIINGNTNSTQPGPGGNSTQPGGNATQPGIGGNGTVVPPTTTLPGDPAAELAKTLGDGGQLKTIAFSGLAWLTGTWALDTFLPPGKVGDYFSFQYMRDIDAAGMGHNGNFLTRIAGDVLSVLSPAQTQALKALALNQATNTTRFARMRYPIMAALRRALNGSLPAGTTGLSRTALLSYSADLYALDGHLAYRRAQVLAAVLASLSAEQRTALGQYKFGDYNSWVDKPEVISALQSSLRGTPQEADAANTVMGLASEMFSWYYGSLESDVFFVPERQAMYFGAFGMKTLPARSKNISIPLGFTGDGGENFLKVVTPEQGALLTAAKDTQKPWLQETVTLRRSISAELRKFMSGTTPDYATVINLSRRYGELDGEMAYLYGSAFLQISAGLSAEQRATLTSLRTFDPVDPTGPFLYAMSVTNPVVASSDFLFQ